SLAPGAKDPSGLLGALPGVTSVTRTGNTYRAKCSNGEALVPKTVMSLSQAGIDVLGVAVIKPTLDEVFLGLTGHAYREEGEAPAAVTGPDAGTASAAGGA
ncbi:MAG: DUF4162 domain-containing protein, partial [Thermoplasmata archaeon]|nr:DUF4162 domain-containing protein [Thermoplasmata archaeon]